MAKRARKKCPTMLHRRPKVDITSPESLNERAKLLLKIARVTRRDYHRMKKKLSDSEEEGLREMTDQAYRFQDLAHTLENVSREKHRV